jgi:lysozyme
MGEKLNTIIDTSHYQRGANWVKVKAGGIVACIVKATQGTHIKDDQFDRTTANVKAQGMLHGAYHFGTFGDGKQQADWYLSVVKPTPETLMALDFESAKTKRNPNAKSMTSAQAVAFILRIHERTGRWPLFYSYSSWAAQNLDPDDFPTIAKCRFWMAGYVSPARLKIPKPFKVIDLWQYANGAAGIQPRAVAGMPGDCDRNQFDGSFEELKAWWYADSVEHVETDADAPEVDGSDDDELAQTDSPGLKAPEPWDPEDEPPAPDEAAKPVAVEAIAAVPPAPVEVPKQSPSMWARIVGVVGAPLAAIGAFVKSGTIDINALIANGSAAKILAGVAAMIAAMMPFLLAGGACAGVYFLAMWFAHKRNKIQAATAANPLQASVTFK